MPLLLGPLAKQGPSSPAPQRACASASMGWQGHSPCFICSLALSEASSLIARLKRYRWIVPAQGEVELKVHFSTQKPGKFEQTLRFELVGSKRQYELPCSGTGLYPSISQDPR